MIVDVTTFEDLQVPFDFTLTPDEVELDNDLAELINTIRVEGVLVKGSAQTDVNASIYADIEVECSRCLTLSASSLEIHFNAVFITAENYTEAKEAELGIGDLEVSMLEDDKIDLKELVREQILLNLPTHFLCEENCRGLCPMCGANRNLIDCKCEKNEIDPRWKALGDLKF